MTARNILWEEIKQAKANQIYLQRYIDRQRRKFWTFLSWDVLDSLFAFYTHHLFRLQMYWVGLESGHLNGFSVIADLARDKELEGVMLARLNSLMQHIPEEEGKEIDKKAKEYIDRIYFDNETK